MVAFGYFSWRLKNKQPENLPESASFVGAEVATRKPSVRPSKQPDGTFSVELTRLPLPQLPIIALDDHGDVLFITSESKREYQTFENGKLQTLLSPAVNVQECLLQSGKIVQLTDEPIIPLSSPLSFPFREELKQPFFFSDGSIAITKPVRLQYIREHMPHLHLPAKYANFKHDFFTLRRETIVCSLVPGSQTQTTSTRMRPNFAKTPGSPNQPTSFGGSISVNSSNYINKIVHSAEVYASEKMLTLLCIEPDDTVWVSEHTGFVTAGSDQLLKIHGEQKDVIPLPKDYRNVHRIVATNGQVVGTFGITNGNEPFRAFLKQGANWNELPIPEGFDCSFAQQILANGMILGYITTWDGKKLRNVVWSGSQLTILNDSPAWPKHGVISLVTHANHAGTIAVQNVTNAASGASEYYLLKLKL